MATQKTRILVLCLAFLAGMHQALRASSMSVNPVRVELSPQHPHTSLQVSNDGDQDLTVQVHAISWERGAGDEMPAETQDLILNPPVFAIAPHQTQTIRIGLRLYNVKTVEQTYRIILEEVPIGQTEGLGLRTIMRVSIPIFLPPSGKAEPALTWELISSGLLASDSTVVDRRLSTLRVENHGNIHAQLKQLSIIAVDTGKILFTKTVSAYVLPGEHREFPLNISQKPNQGKLLLRAETDRGSITEDLTR